LIDGSVEGLIQLDERKLTVGATAKLTADIHCPRGSVYGSVKGNLRAKDRIEIKKDGSVNGDLTTARISIEDGAYFKGSIEIDKSAERNRTAVRFRNRRRSLRQRQAQDDLVSVFYIKTFSRRGLPVRAFHFITWQLPIVYIS